MERILYVDDCQADIEYTRELFDGEKIAIDSANNVDDGMNLLLRRKYAVVICDILMPGGNGVAFLKNLPKNNISVPSILTSGVEDFASFESYTGLPDYLGFILKPVTPEAIRRLMEKEA